MEEKQNKPITTARLMGFNYSLHIVPADCSELSVNEEEEPDSSATVDHLTKSIYIAKNMTQDVKFSNLIHEVIHTVLEHSGMRYMLENAGVTEEIVVLALENGLVQFIQDQNYDLRSLYKILQ